MSTNEKNIVVVVGPTASGKTTLAIQLARERGGEIVSADARQVYRGMSIGTAKPTDEEQRAAPHHLIDVVDPDEQYSAARFAQDAASAIEKIISDGKLPILAGGSGFYIDALLRGLSPIPTVPDKIRERFQREADDNLGRLHEMLVEVDPEAGARIHPNDRQRITRALEVEEFTGVPLSDLQKKPRVPGGEWDQFWISVDVDREDLYGRIDRRTDEMIRLGLVDEVRGLLKKGFDSSFRAMNTFGYREILDHLGGGIELEEAIERIKTETRHYAKRQLPWFRSNPEIAWMAPSDSDTIPSIFKKLDTLQRSS